MPNNKDNENKSSYGGYATAALVGTLFGAGIGLLASYLGSSSEDQSESVRRSAYDGKNDNASSRNDDIHKTFG